MKLKEYCSTKWTKFLVALVLAAAVSFATYESIRPAAASAVAFAPPAAPLSPDSVNALLSLDHAMENLAAHVTPAVVNITVTSREKQSQTDDQMPEGMQRFFGQGGPFGQFFGQRMMPQQPQIEHGLGSGVVISPDGYIVTNNHVVENATDIRVTTSNRRVLKAKLIGTDPLTDLAVIKVDATGLASVPWGNSASVEPGETVLAFGDPYGFSFTVTRGIVSAINRANPDSTDPRKPGEFIQTDAAINPGNSGGPLVNARGEVIGINTFLISPSGSFSGMGFAIPAKIAEPTVQELIRDGKVNHSHIGVGITDVTPENAKFFDDSTATGAVVTEVEPDSPGAKAGLKIGDVITQVDGQKVSDSGELQVIISEKQPGTKVTLTVLRDGKDMSVPVTLEQMGNRPGEASANGEGQGKMRWGIGVSDLTPDVRSQIQVSSDVHGAVVEHVQPGSPADNAGLRNGDVILEVNRHAVNSAAQVQEALSAVPKGQDALLLVWSNGGNTFRVLRAPEGS